MVWFLRYHGEVMYIRSFNEVLVIDSRLDNEKRVACFIFHMQIYLIKELKWKLDLKFI